MSGVVSRWEKERAAWLMGRSQPGRSSRRRAELLGRRARRLSRGGTGISETSLHEDVTPPLFRRWLTTSDGAGEQLARLIFVPLLFAIAWLVAWPAVAIGAGLYYLRWKKAPTIGRLLDWPWFVAGVAVGIAGAALWHLSGVGPGLWFVPWPVAVHVYLPVFVPTYLCVQTTAGLLLTGWLVHANGWAAVPKGAAPKPEKDKNGEYLKVAEKDKVRLASRVGTTDKKDSPAPGEKPDAAPKKIALSTMSQEAATPPANKEEDVVFADEDAGLEDEEPVFES
ncbi:hypothetical protein GCM10023160_18680 [Brachybacterium paraconglomeratum]|uniref:hypothetical protein n=1 Tax=Brachybacterium paraconglomeratum TaxID=173362 RepID=UPI0031F0523A